MSLLKCRELEVEKHPTSWIPYKEVGHSGNRPAIACRSVFLIVVKAGRGPGTEFGSCALTRTIPTGSERATLDVLKWEQGSCFSRHFDHMTAPTHYGPRFCYLASQVECVEPRWVSFPLRDMATLTHPISCSETPTLWAGSCHALLHPTLLGRKCKCSLGGDRTVPSLSC